MSALRAPLAVLAVALLAACSSTATPEKSSGPQPSQHSAATLTLGSPVPLPKGPVVLTIKKAKNANRGGDLVLDLDQIEAMGTVAMTVNDETSSGKTSVFTGPYLRTVFAYAGVDGTTVHASALNDYVVDVPMSDAKELPLVLATRQDGKRLSVAENGPTRFVYPSSGWNLDPAVYNPRMIWQVKEINVG